DFDGLASHERPSADSGENILDIVRTFERDLADQHHLTWGFTVEEEDFAVADEGSALDFFLPAEPEHLCAGSIAQGLAGGIVLVQHGEVRRLLILEDARLRIDIGLKDTMPVEVVGRDVENDSDLRAEGLDGLQLKARNFEYHDRLPGSALDKRDGRG